MKEIDSYSYHLGAADCFCEMVAAGVKKIALSHPCNSKEERDSFLDDFNRLSEKYNVKYYAEDRPFLSDLFPVSMNKGKHNVIFYCEDRYLEQYLQLKKDKQQMIDNNCYCGKERTQLAIRYGKLLSYTDEGIERLLKKNNEKE
ncbi:MAG: hypothetical protein IJG59_05075 [Erysipelotrichaceae bacterium]|nr:hypothetical protein [Erysipelotrichaceae bacterium]